MKLLILLFVPALCLGQGLFRIPTQIELSSFIQAVPRFPTKSPDQFPRLPEITLIREFNTSFRGRFKPFEGCSLNKTLDLWDYGTIQTPNYPEDYPPNTACEWMLEGPPGSKIQATVFDLVTQNWFLGYYDYVAFSRDGNFEKVDYFSGDVNNQSPFTVDSYQNKFGVRFSSNGYSNYRGLKLSYVVVPVPQTAENHYKISNDDGVCGRSFILGSSSSTEAPGETTTAPVGETTAAPVETTTTGHFGDTKIIGDTKAPPNAYPWMVAMLIDGRGFCGGSIIDDRHIMTAAHCTDGAKEIVVLLGGHDLTASKEDEPHRRVINVTAANIHQHPKYNDDTVTHDISIIRLDEKIEFSDAIRPICLPNREFVNEFFVAEAVNVTGWGITGDKQGISKELQVTNVTVMNNKECHELFREVLTGNQVCTATTPTNSPCRGDSGGPLFLNRSGPMGDYLMQIGIVSFGTVSCERGWPVAYTRVTAFLDYINQVTGKSL